MVLHAAVAVSGGIYCIDVGLLRAMPDAGLNFDETAVDV
jgi:hypothetical protein